MVNFRQLVESLLLCEGDVKVLSGATITSVDTFITAYTSQFPNTIPNKRDLAFIYSQLLQNRIAGKNWRYELQCFPLFFAIIVAYGTLNEARKAATQAQSKPNKEDVFYTTLHTHIQSNLTDDKKNLISYLLDNDPIDYNDKKKIPPEGAYYYKLARDEDSMEVLKQDVWPLINKMTITNAVTNTIQTRLTGMEKIQLKFAFFTPLSVLRSKGSFDKILEETIDNYNNFIRGKYTFTKEFQDILHEIDITPKDLALLIHYTREVIKKLVTDKGVTEQKNIDKVINENNKIKKFCKEGILEYYDDSGATKVYEDTDPSDPSKTVQVQFTLDKLETMATKGSEESKELIKIIKEMSTGVRAKSEAWKKFKEERFQYLVQAASSIAGFAGAKLYG